MYLPKKVITRILETDVGNTRMYCWKRVYLSFFLRLFLRVLSQETVRESQDEKPLILLKLFYSNHFQLICSIAITSVSEADRIWTTFQGFV